MYDRVHSRQIADYGGVVNPCRSSPPSSHSSRWPTVLPATRASSASSWSSSVRSVENFWVGLRRRVAMISSAGYSPVDCQKRAVFIGNHHDAPDGRRSTGASSLTGAAGRGTLGMGVSETPLTMEASVARTWCKEVAIRDRIQ